jgi:preprotein translocase subunit SecE
MDKVFKAFENIKKYIQAVRTELKRVTWPSKQELRASTVIVLITLITVTAYLWICDSVLLKLFEKIRGF